jgi:7-keto-8-aminopelargonate synthetase-like enzyme
LIEWLINRARSFIFSTAPPPALAGAALAAVDFLASPEGEKRRELLWQKIKMLREQLAPKFASDKNNSPGSAIFPWIVGDERAAVNLSGALMNEGLLVPAVRYPTVAKGSARLRITVTASHEQAQIEALGEALRRLFVSKVD